MKPTPLKIPVALSAIAHIGVILLLFNGGTIERPAPERTVSLQITLTGESPNDIDINNDRASTYVPDDSCDWEIQRKYSAIL